MDTFSSLGSEVSTNKRTIRFLLLVTAIIVVDVIDVVSMEIALLRKWKIAAILHKG
jgi:hypothetical protein